jgi:hypothetical protein
VKRDQDRDNLRRFVLPQNSDRCGASQLLIVLTDLVPWAIRDCEQLVYISNSGEKAQTREAECHSYSGTARHGEPFSKSNGNSIFNMIIRKSIEA